MFSFLAPKIGCSLSSASISLLLLGFCCLCFLMWAHIFFVTSVLGSGSVPTISASWADGRIGFMNALFVALVDFFGIFLSFAPVGLTFATKIVLDQMRQRPWKRSAKKPTWPGTGQVG